ncbi:DUF1624 domain-containing protein [Exilibacterium tricleocarpae]|uniref:DUF1624 domain-containing protein n=1 Tax=Exilibacterium tricleocarpae TaxID=2591008 RepID=A0A545TNX8_9GAMM|nr:heparan-alpha-glucosaminide N-acetyltransferase domain-containing protein [Exilibacterium tricleocarpae]TQV78924.1 DUF1624 domain-containing protein [Exilibacterium tricleocarpae]
MRDRFRALDVFRGYTVAAMILVNTPGSWSHVYAPLRHAPWHGWTPTDLIFPYFLFIVGAAMYFSLHRLSGHLSPALVKKIVVRGSLIFLIGLLLNALPFQEPLSNLRIMGVLQRIGLVYIGAALIVISCGQTARALVAAGLLLGYWGGLYAGGGYDLLTNPARALDLAVLGESHMWKLDGVAFDPEGLLSTLPALVTTLIGYEITRVLCRDPNPYRRVKILCGAGAGLVLAGLIWHLWLPINKSLWTPSFVLLSGGMAMLTLAVCIAVADLKPIAAVTFPGEVFGLNPLFIYALSWVWVGSYWVIQVNDGAGGVINGHTALYQWFLQGLSPINASLAFALAHITLFWGIAWVLFKRNIIIKL